MKKRKRIERLETMVAALQTFAIRSVDAQNAACDAMKKCAAVHGNSDARIAALEALHAEPEPAKVSGRPVSFSEKAGESCCDMRRKVVAAVVAVLPEESCGLNESVLADFVTFNEEASEKPILRFAFCPWCGTPRGPDSEERVTPPPFSDGSGS